MVGFRKVVVQVLATLLFIILLGGACAFSFNHVVGKADAVETSLRNSGVYDGIADYAITRATQSASTTNGSVVLNNPQIQAIAKSVFSKQLVQQNAETFINSNYSWLSGETQKPSFTLDVSSAKQTFASQVGKTVLDYLKTLPTCSPTQLAQLQASASIDPLTISCLPATVLPQAEATRVTNQILSSDFLTQPVVTAETLKISDQSTNNKPYYEQFNAAPSAYRALQKAPLALSILALITALSLIFIAPNRSKGVRRAGLTFALAGLVLIAAKYLSDAFFPGLEAKVFSGAGTTDVQKPLLDALHELEKQLVTTNLYVGIAFVIIGLILVAAYIRMRPTKGVKALKTPKAPSVPVEPIAPVQPTVPAATNTAPPQEVRPRPRRRLIQ